MRAIRKVHLIKWLCQKVCALVFWQVLLDCLPLRLEQVTMPPAICYLLGSNRVLSNSPVFANLIGGRMVLICMFLMNELSNSSHTSEPLGCPPRPLWFAYLSSLPVFLLGCSSFYVLPILGKLGFVIESRFEKIWLPKRTDMGAGTAAGTPVRRPP